jgi:hypothetical protein
LIPRYAELRISGFRYLPLHRAKDDNDMKLTIIRIKPNPTGKDRPRNGAPTPTQLAAEWVDWRNDTGSSVNLAGVALWHKAYNGNQWSWERITGFTGTVGAGEIVRVHSGKPREGVISPEDRAGAHHHIFTGDDRYVWNNREDDTPLLHNDPRNETIDSASYDPNPPEGAVLVRLGAKLVRQASAAGW